MIHDLTDNGAKVYITYDIDFVPASSPAAASIKPLHPIWMDVESHNIYPVFDVHRFSGKNGKFTFPDMAKNPYRRRRPAEHVHGRPSRDDRRHGRAPASGWSLRRARRLRAGATPSGGAIAGYRPALGATVPLAGALLRPARPDLVGHGDDRDRSRLATAPQRRRHAADQRHLRDQARLLVRGDGDHGRLGGLGRREPGPSTDPFSHATDQTGHVTHGHLAENRHHGGSIFVGVNLKKFPDVLHATKVIIGGFHYTPGRLHLDRAATAAPRRSARASR